MSRVVIRSLHGNCLGEGRQDRSQQADHFRRRRVVDKQGKNFLDERTVFSYKNPLRDLSKPASPTNWLTTRHHYPSRTNSTAHHPFTKQRTNLVPSIPPKTQEIVSIPKPTQPKHFAPTKSTAMAIKKESVLPVLLAAVAGYPATKGTVGAGSAASSSEEAAEPKKKKKKRTHKRRVGAGQAKFYREMDKKFDGDLDKAAEQQLAELSVRKSGDGDGEEEDDERNHK
ncbi:hypothetical protein PG993_013071 [Apiospora rasikravindrae]|uniref:Uncharacterized protein n=1 Tax=Apiospora rasikravindrae TaxID=990691 RepID=A0ABR1RWL2_9PEZI